MTNVATLSLFFDQCCNITVVVLTNVATLLFLFSPTLQHHPCCFDQRATSSLGSFQISVLRGLLYRKSNIWNQFHQIWTNKQTISLNVKKTNNFTKYEKNNKSNKTWVYEAFGPWTLCNVKHKRKK